MAGASVKKEHLGKRVLCKFCCEVDEQSEPVIIVIEVQYRAPLCNKEHLRLCLDPSVLGGRKSIISWFPLLRMVALNGVTVGILFCTFGRKYFLFVEISSLREAENRNPLPIPGLISTSSRLGFAAQTQRHKRRWCRRFSCLCLGCSGSVTSTGCRNAFLPLGLRAPGWFPCQ